MRSVTAGERRSDRGAVVVWVALMMVVLLGVGALTVDLGALHVERQRLRTGAEASALAVARDCVDGDCGPATSTARAWAPRNDPDGAMGVTVVCGVASGLAACPPEVPVTAAMKAAAGWVHVATRTARPDGSSEVPLRLAPIIGALSSISLQSRATVAWGGLAAATTVPLAMSVCEFQALGGNPNTGTFPVGLQYVYFHGVGGRGETGVGRCTASTSGQDLPGGFGWLTANTCSLTVKVGDWLSASTGNSPSQACRNQLSNWRNAVIQISLFDAESGTGSGGRYRIAGIAAFRVLGYRFPGDTWPRNFRCPAASGNSGTCLYGEFTRVTTSGGSLGGPDFGTRTTRLVG